MPTLFFDHYYRYAELAETLQAFAAEYPMLCQVRSIGQSYEGRDIWLALLTNTATGPDTDKPALWMDANIHATEVSPTTCALYTLNKILSGYGTDERLTRLLDTRVLYIVPRLNPDGAELYLDGRLRRVRSSTRLYPRLDKQDGLHEEDFDKDGRLLTMRVKDPNGFWKTHPDEPRLMVPRAADGSDSGPYYRLLAEGTIQNYDGALIKNAPTPEGLDLNRNFPYEWAIESEQHGAGPYPTSEPEVRAAVQFMTDHPNITTAVTFHTFSGVYLRPYDTHPDDFYIAEDLLTYKAMGKKITELTGYPAVSVFHEFKYHPKETIKGAFDAWVFEQLGAFAWTCELWSPQKAAGLDLTTGPDGKGGSRYIDWYHEHPIEEDLKLIKWCDENLPDQGYVNWYSVSHPQLGEVELGGWNNPLIWRNPPPHLLEKEVAPHAEAMIWLGLITPLLAWREVKVTPLAEDAYHIRAVIENTGWLPTYVTERAKEKKLVRPLEVEITLPEGATLVSGERKAELGQLAGRALKRTTFWNSDPSSDRAKVEWVVKAPAGTTLTLTAFQARAGRLTQTITL